MADYVKSFMQAVSYIEENLTNEITLADISIAAGLSTFHFTRVFHQFVGETLSSYIRKRRLTEASGDLIENKLRIIDIAFKYRFQSQAAFTRSFKKQFQLTPKRVRRISKEIKFGEVKALNVQNLIHRTGGGITLEPEIIRSEDISLIGKRTTFTMEKNNVPRLWGQFFIDMKGIKNTVDWGTYGVSIYKEDSDDSNIERDFKFDYLVGCRVHITENIPKGMTAYKIPAGEYAVFTHIGLSQSLHQDPQPPTYSFS